MGVKATLMDVAAQGKGYIGGRKRPRTIPCRIIRKRGIVGTKGGEVIPHRCSIRVPVWLIYGGKELLRGVRYSQEFWKDQEIFGGCVVARSNAHSHTAQAGSTNEPLPLLLDTDSPSVDSGHHFLSRGPLPLGAV